ncbi:adhesion G protein-coupled receptor F4 [Notolabrus celidotus]|uniref:adhesion G protein-coupled receptor F4 n=1 Tax=Notolabrus celidotus TaxID=1203425 RepID=UPI00149035D2|nr:adhesion G protein-coupled receptor F4 [Notolabrus celidotus]
MHAREFLFLIGAVCLYSQVITADTYSAELMVESNVTLEAETVRSSLQNTADFTVTENGSPFKVTLGENELVAECLVFGDESTCNCSDNYTWSNEVCYKSNCCRELTCTQNVSDVTPLCVAKIKVSINGSVNLQESWSSDKTAMLKKEFEVLNGFEILNVTDRGDGTADFEVAVSVKFETSRLQAIVTSVETNMNAALVVDTKGLVTIESPVAPVCYQSDPVLKCTFDEKTERASWTMSRKHEHFELADGSVVELDESCSTMEQQSCVGVKLTSVTGIWAGTYECGFTSGSVRHTAKSQLHVALLPDDILLKINPLTVVCSSEESQDVTITATILSSPEVFNVWCTYNREYQPICNKTNEDHHVYTFKVSVSCKKDVKPHIVRTTFENSKKQKKHAEVTIPVIYEGKAFCEEEMLDGEFWPKTPNGDTAINRTCAEDKTGFKSRTCKDLNWQPVFYSCINQDIQNNLLAADNFLKGLGATPEVAKDIFSQLKNSSAAFHSDSSDTTANIDASINILNKMAEASEMIVLSDGVLNDFVGAASMMLDTTWTGINKSVSHDMSSNYLMSVESLVKNIKVNRSSGIDTQNLQLEFCSRDDCNVSVFDINLNLNKSSGIMKTLAIKNLMEKLRNNYRKTEPTSLLVSATLQDSNDSSIEIRLDFPTGWQNYSKRYCVFWNTTNNDWSDKGCTLKSSDSYRTICECNHLTSFSILMAKSDISTEDLDMITNVGLGVSICSLVIFLTVEALVWSAVVKSNLSHFRHTALVNIAVFLLLADCCFLASSSPEDLSESLCLAFTVCKHLFYLAMFSWMLCMSVMLVHQLIFVFSPLRKRVFMFLSSIVGYVCPVLIVGSSYVYCKYTGKNYFEPEACWLVFDGLLEGSIHAFVIPVGTVILTNLFSMVVVIITLVKSSAPTDGKSDDKETVKSIIKVVVFLTPVFGLTWIIGFAMLMLKQSDPMYQVANYSFTILNSFQGLFLLLTGCFAEQKVRTELIRLVRAKSNGRSESMKNLTSTTYTKDK